MNKELKPATVAAVLVVVIAIVAGLVWMLTGGPKPRTISMGQMKGPGQVRPESRPTGRTSTPAQQQGATAPAAGNP